MNHIALLGAEEVGRAGHDIAAAAEEIVRAANQIDLTAINLINALAQHSAAIDSLVMRMKVNAPRKVTLFRRIPTPGQKNTMVEIGEAIFLTWGNEFEEFENGPGNYTVAIVQMPDGSIDTFMPSCVRFEVPA